MDKILILDFGGQYAHLIANRLRRLGVYSEIAAPDTRTSELRKAKGIILSGGPSSVMSRSSPKFNRAIFSLKRPVLGICYGHQLMAYVMKGKVHPGKGSEYGSAQVQTRKSAIFKGFGKDETVWMSHGDSVHDVPKGFSVTASSSECAIAGMADEKRKYYGVQFHPEVTHTPNGMRILDNFIRLTGAKRTWNMERYLKDISKEIRQKAKGKNVFLLVSGGVDSSVCFMLLNKLLGQKRVLGLHIDNGLMRKSESREVERAMKKAGFSNLNVVDASESFLEELEGIVHPERKRRIIGEHFIAVYRKAVSDLHLDPKKWLLAQGTIYPDTIETGGTKHSSLIKTHHNRVPLLQKMIKKGLVLEPLANLYKDEVRALGKLIGLQPRFVDRHPFPGPGLGVRCLCSDGKGTVALNVNRRLKRELKGTGYLGYVAPIRSVGVQGDNRTYRHPVILEGKLDYKKLEELSPMITNRIHSVNRVMLVLGKTDPAMSLSRASLTSKRLDLLREADSIVTKTLKKHRLYHTVWQMPVVLLPYGSRGRESIVLRPIDSTEAMTASFSKLPKKALDEMVKGILSLGLDAVFLDLTNKPPGTIEWE